MQDSGRSVWSYAAALASVNFQPEVAGDYVNGMDQIFEDDAAFQIREEELAFSYSMLGWTAARIGVLTGTGPP
ncbi:hypothetical protein SH668x_000266 [Planctomicrobium sp. SH668]|uniref:hypothetical protein n=1 Tax=Planctomicrobium sp. SH668 TaxID=3448126 RepID=UPI003F5B5CF5